MKIERRRLLAAAAGTVMVGASPWTGRADAATLGFPNRPLTWIVPYPPGGPGDLLARTVGDAIGPRLHQPVIVDSRPGAGGQIAGSALVRAEPDGHTLMLGDTSTLCVNRAVYKSFGWDPVADARGIAAMLIMPMLLLVPAASPWQTMSQLVEASRRGVVNYASQGSGSTGHLLGEMLRDATGGRLNHVPYKGSAPAMNDLLGGQVDMLFDGVPPAMQHLAAGRLRALAVAAPRRAPQLPDVPTTAELGLPNVAMSIWFGAVTRRGVPDAAVDRLHDEIAAAMARQDVSRRFTDLGFQPLDMDATRFSAYIREETTRWADFVRTRSISSD